MMKMIIASMFSFFLSVAKKCCLYRSLTALLLFGCVVLSSACVPCQSTPPTWSQTLPASERFVLVLNDEAVLDKETGLVWARDANLFGQRSWISAVICCRNLNIGNRKGWRLPTVEELASLVDPTQSNPALPSGHPFEDFPSHNYCFYWSSTTSETISDEAWDVLFWFNGAVGSNPKTSSFYVWPVRGSGPILVPHTP